MFDTLPASHAIHAPLTRTIIIALVLHLLTIAAAIRSTASPPAGTRLVARDTIRLEMSLVEASQAKSEQALQTRLEPIIPGPPDVPDIPMTGPEFQAPPLSVGQPGRPESHETSPQPGSGESTPLLDSSPAIFGSMEADEPPELQGELQLHYPEGLRRAGLSGLVQVQYVVKSNGRVDARSIRVLSSSHPAFLMAAVQALRGARFRPARQGGRPTAVLVQQTIRFRQR
jgi:periplasmic protein TonB